MNAEAWIDVMVRRTGPVETVRERPWATILRAETADGPVWLKQAGEGTRFEAPLYEILARVVPDRVLVPLAVDAARGWILLPDGGPPVGDWDGVEAALGAYGEMQRALSPHVDELLAAGVPDMQPAVMPERFETALEVACSYDGANRGALEALRKPVGEWCAELAVAPGPISLDHNDLHPWNVLLDARFYDWGDSVVAHAFASLLVPERQAGGRRLRDAYLEPFTDLAPRSELDRAADVARRVASVARVLTWDRAIRSLPPADRDPRWARAPLEELEALL